MDINEDVCFVVVGPTLSKVGGNCKFGNTDEQIYRFLSVMDGAIMKSPSGFWTLNFLKIHFNSSHSNF